MSKLDLRVNDQVIIKENKYFLPINGIVLSFSQNGECVWVRELNSMNETFVPLIEIEPIVLRNGYLIKV